MTFPLIVGGMVLCAVGLILTIWRSMNRQVERAEEEHAARIMTLHAEGRVTADGEPICMVEGCSKIARRPMPIIDQPAWDKIWFIRWIHKLYAMPWRYAVSFDYELGHQVLCVSHGKQCVEKAEHFIATIRAEHAEFNARQLDKVAIMNNGGLHECLRASQEKIHTAFSVSAISYREEREDSTFALPTTTSDSDHD